MHWLQLQFTPCEALPSVWIGFASQYSQACGHPCCLCTLSYPISSFQSTLHLICFDTLLPPLSLMTLCVLPSLWKVSMIIFWTIAKSSPLLWFQRTRDTRNLYCMNGHLLKLKCKYSNILRYLIFLLSWAKLKSSKLKQQKKHLKCFTLHVINLKYMKVSLFEISYKKKLTFSRYSFFF